MKRFYELLDDANIPYGKVSTLKNRRSDYNLMIQHTSIGWVTNIIYNEDHIPLHMTEFHFSIILSAKLNLNQPRDPLGRMIPKNFMTRNEIILSIFNEYKVHGEPNKEKMVIPKDVHFENFEQTVDESSVDSEPGTFT